MQRPSAPQVTERGATIGVVRLSFFGILHSAGSEFEDWATEAKGPRPSCYTSKSFHGIRNPEIDYRRVLDSFDLHVSRCPKNLL